MTTTTELKKLLFSMILKTPISYMSRRGSKGGLCRNIE